MNPRIAAFAVVALASVAAAGIGGYIAVRQSVPGTAAPVLDSGVAEGVIENKANVDGPLPASTPEPSVAVPPVVPPAPAADSARNGGATPVVAARPRPSKPSRPVEPAVAATLSPAVTSAEPQRTEGPPAQAVPSPAETALPSVPVAEAVYAPPPDPGPQLEELVVPADAVVGLQIDRTISSDSARVEDRVDARVTREVRVGGEVAVPTGARVEGTVVMVERGGKFKERARLGVRFHTVVLADGSRLSMHSEPVFREGDSPSSESAKKVGGAAVGGAIIGAILGGGRGAAIGAATGAAGGTAAVAAGGRNPALLTAGTTVTVRLAAPMSVIRERE